MNWRLAAWWTSAVALAAGALGHFAMVLIVLTPVDVPSGVRSVAEVYVEPVFRQGWWLFAPNPPVFDRRVEVRGTYAEGVEQQTPWLPVTEPVIRAVQENRLSKHDVTLSVLLHALYSLSEGSLAFLPPEVRDLVVASWTEPSRQPASLIALERAGSAALAAEYPGRDLHTVQVRMTLRRLPAFSERDQPLGEPETEVVFEPVPFQRVAPWSPHR